MSNTTNQINFSQIKGQAYSKRAIEVAIAGCHSTILVGTLGSGKTLFLDAIKYLVPEDQEILLSADNLHNFSKSKMERFCDLKDQYIIASTRSCQCGYYTHPYKECTCTVQEIRKFKRLIPMNLIDNFQLFIDLPTVKWYELTSEWSEETSEAIKERIVRTRKIQAKRYNSETMFNGFYSNVQDHIAFRVNDDSSKLLEMAYNKFNLTPRAHYNIIRIARTCSDLAQEEKIKSEHIAEAIQYRILDEELRTI